MRDISIPHFCGNLMSNAELWWRWLDLNQHLAEAALSVELHPQGYVQ